LGDLTKEDRYLPLPAEVASNSARPADFFQEPSAQHIQSIEGSLERLASIVTSETESPARTVELVVVKHPGWWHHRLYVFSIVDFDADGHLVDTANPGEVIRFAVVANHAVELVVQAVLDMFGRLVARNTPSASNARTTSSSDNMDIEAAALDQAAHAEIVDVLRHGWVHAAEQLKRQSVAQGVALKVSLATDAFKTEEARRHRATVLRQIYNSDEIAREAVDRLVGAMAGRQGRLMMDGGAERLRARLESYAEAAQVMKYFQHCLRDALVLGNGYITFARDVPFGPYCVRPEDVTHDDKGNPRRGGGAGEHIEDLVHIPGVVQPRSRLGLSMLEPIVIHAVELQSAKNLAYASQALLERGPEDEKAKSSATAALARRMLETIPGRMSEALQPALTFTSPALESLYFDGAELM
jgi:hypothetical protein